MTLYKKYLLMREEIMKHKWIESEKNNGDVGFDFALRDWIAKHRRNWIRAKVVDNNSHSAKL